MHHLNVSLADQSTQSLEVIFAREFTNRSRELKIANLVKDKIREKQFFYGLEVAAQSNSVLDFRSFNFAALFTSVVWLGEIYANIHPITSVPAVRFANQLQLNQTVLPHFTCYKTTKKQLENFLEKGFSNVLALRGDQVLDGQDYQYASSLVEEIRKIKGDNISIGVAGYPELHPDSKSSQDDLSHLKNKVESGADFIITQLCFNADNLINFIKDCRKTGIKVPIIPGVFIPHSYRALQRMCEITKVVIPEDQLKEFERLQNDQIAFENYAVENAVKFIKKLFSSNLNIYGVQFFTLNQFDLVAKVVNELFPNDSFENKIN